VKEIPLPTSQTSPNKRKEEGKGKEGKLGQGNQSSLRTRMFTLQKGRIVRNRKL
jgi:hypothetical protein